jgi:aminoglycoside phosphotransferase (APT) family kinase protein
MPNDDSLDADISDAMVREMVRSLQPAWRVEDIRREEHGTDFVASLAVQTPDGSRQVVLKATTAGLVGELARTEPRLLELVGRETRVPVPTVFGFRDDHPEFPTPYYLLSYEAGENFEGRPDALSPVARERVLHEAGENLAEIHALGPLDAVGEVGVRDGELTVLDTEDHPSYEDTRQWALADGLEAIDTLDSGGFFPQFAEDPERFADLVPALRTYVEETAPALPAPAEPTYCHRDYRYGNLLLHPETGEAEAVLDWAGTLSVEPAYNLAIAESLLLDPAGDGERRTRELRETFRTAYAASRDEWRFDAATCERMRLYRLVCRLHAMACLPLWHREASADRREEIEDSHREFVADYLDDRRRCQRE